MNAKIKRHETASPTSAVVQLVITLTNDSNVDIL